MSPARAVPDASSSAAASIGRKPLQRTRLPLETSRDHTRVTTERYNDLNPAGFTRSWASLSGALTYAGNGDIHVFGSSADGAGIFVVRPDGTSSSVLRAGDTLPEGGIVVQAIGIFAGPNGEVFIAVHILENGKEKIATYLATPVKS